MPKTSSQGNAREDGLLLFPCVMKPAQRWGRHPGKPGLQKEDAQSMGAMRSHGDDTEDESSKFTDNVEEEAARGRASSSDIGARFCHSLLRSGASGS